MPRLSRLALIASVIVMFAVAVVLYLHMRFAIRPFKPEISTAFTELPPGEPAPIKFAAPNMSSAERKALLTADYKIVRQVADLPNGIRKLYTVKGGDGGRNPEAAVAAVPQDVCESGAPVDSTGAVVACTAVAAVLFGAQRAAADGRDGLQHIVSLVCGTEFR